MKIHLVLAVGLAARVCLGGVHVGGLPDWEHADTEVSTNCPFAFPQMGARHFLLALELAGTPSNNVQVAFGRDADEDGVLGIDETEMVLGWDCGCWRARKGIRDQVSGIREWTAEAATTNVVKTLAVDVSVFRDQGRSLESAENGVDLDWGAAAELPRALYDNRWNMLRLTARGVDRAEESLRASVWVDGTKIIIR